MKEDYSLSARRGISKSRIIALGVVISILLLIYTGYLFSLQIVSGSVFSVKAEEMSRRSLPIPAQRGEIFDRNYDKPLVTNVDSFAIDIIPAEVPDGNFGELFEKLSVILNIGIDEIQEKIPEKYHNLYYPIEIKSGETLETITYIAENMEDFTGVGWHNKPRRVYLEGKNMAHVLGHVGDINTEELQVLFNQGYSIGSVLGKSGIERQYDMLLRGKEGRRYRKVDVQGKRIDDAVIADVEPELGKHLVLTIDRHIQELAVKALGERVGSVVVMNPGTGEILALASYPAFDPNIFSAEDTEDEITALDLDQNSPYLNRAIRSGYPPASTFKTIMTTAIIEEEAFPLDEEVYCSGALRVGNRVFHCWQPYGHGALNLSGGLAQSCNVFFYTMGRDYLTIDQIVDYCRKLGLGDKTGIDLPGEISGLVPSPAWKERTQNEIWVGGDTVNMSIGQGYLIVTPIQMANALSMIVNEGIVYKPHLLKEVRDPVSHEVIEELEPQIARSSGIRKSTFKLVKQYLRGVIVEGTASVVITTDTVQVAGKTGTAQTPLEENKHSWFIAFAPYEETDPAKQIVVVVMVEGVNEWEWWAPKATNIIIHGIFSGQNYNDTVESLRPLWYLPRE